MEMYSLGSRDDGGWNVAGLLRYLRCVSILSMQRYHVIEYKCKNHLMTAWPTGQFLTFYRPNSMSKCLYVKYFERCRRGPTKLSPFSDFTDVAIRQVPLSSI